MLGSIRYTAQCASVHFYTSTLWMLLTIRRRLSSLHGIQYGIPEQCFRAAGEFRGGVVCVGFSCILRLIYHMLCYIFYILKMSPSPNCSLSLFCCFFVLFFCMVYILAYVISFLALVVSSFVWSSSSPFGSAYIVVEEGRLKSVCTIYKFM